MAMLVPVLVSMLLKNLANCVLFIRSDPPKHCREYHDDQDC
jgi:hypothetical protein